MNIEQITQEVVKELMQEMYLGAASSSPAVPYRRVLILLCRSDLPVQPIFAKLGNWKNKAELTVRAPRWAQSLWRGESLSEVKTEFISFDSGKEAKDLVNNCDRVALIGATRTILHKIGRMDRDSLASAVAVEALQRNKPVMMLDDSWESYKSEASKVQDMGVHLGALTDVDRIFPVPPMPIMPVGSTRPAAAASAQNPLPANCTACQEGTCVTHWSERVRRMMEAGAQRVSSALGLHAVPKDLASMIDHTLLKPEATEDQVRKLCAEAAEYHFASVCVNPGYVSLSAQLLKGTGVMVCTVVGFPLGATDSQTKADETRHAIANGADEIDMVINVGALKSRNYQKVEDDIRAVVQASSGKTVKVILETSLLNDEEKVTACKLSEKAGAHFVKTATGFGPGGATEADIALMRRTVRKDMEVKASGSIRDQATALKMIQAGATRIGASASIAIVKGENAGEGKY